MILSGSYSRLQRSFHVTGKQYDHVLTEGEYSLKSGGTTDLSVLSIYYMLGTFFMVSESFLSKEGFYLKQISGNKLLVKALKEEGVETGSTLSFRAMNRHLSMKQMPMQELPAKSAYVL